MRILNWRIHADNKYSHLLALLIIIFFISPYTEASTTKVPLIHCFFLIALIFTLRALELSRRTFAICAAIGLAALSCELIDKLIFVTDLRLMFDLITVVIYTLFMTTAIVVMIHKMFSTTKVTGDTIRGGICVYILIGYLFAIFFHVIYVFDPGAFYFSERWSNVYFIYFSFTTLTTLGYGDVFPINKLAMVLANVEAMTGQIYLAVFIARMVGLHLIDHVNHHHEKS